MELVFLLTLLPVAHSVNRSLTYFVTLSAGFQDVPEFVGVAMMDGVPLLYCYGDRSEERVDWLQRLAAENPKLSDWNQHICALKYNTSKRILEELRNHTNQTGGAHVLQEASGCQLDTDTRTSTLHDSFALDGEELMTLDRKSWTWNYTDRARTFTADGRRLSSEPDYVSDVYLDLCPEMLKKYLKYSNGSGSGPSPEPPAVVLLQTSPSAPVRCHASGFYPDGPRMFWRRDGERVQEEGEVLPNRDGTFQISAVLNVSSIRTEDWSRYECVFQLSGEKDVITKLDRAAIRTSYGENQPAGPISVCYRLYLFMFVFSPGEPSKTRTAVVMVMVVVVLGLVAAVGFRLYKKKDSGYELYETLTADL
ncbi:class I histocompatibility antigen, Gogo-OKO alpha chain-like isoform X2 [Betta splendens]|uniref:Class I histocompatibility antigen, Gogo-OKO alpha chain-like isoform X2 n=1 Tax=Betta splendens TaxID=158456 RepID=A0A9W2Y4J9_BETSP|nr:class I histocompatibility antigen, Gogo-OKO alpha chain-like isoform X2 [Betta splendens]XP_055368896.1 class I histocompatibility antigen, Gogo-OKO alpha chain-like isoform X2 [Betta splendens]XP_055368897.1 class I histocompatibility antigen, Gogo-OKO alpha chain-like isoform X2 [Betta splendens]